MADQSTQSIEIDAQPADILAVIADFPAYPEWAASVKSCEVLEPGADGGPARQVRFVVDAGVLKDDYVLSYEWAEDRVDWSLVRSTLQKTQKGSYVLVPKGGRTLVTYQLAVDVSIPMLGMFKRKVEKVIMDTALKELKKRVES
jgi:carbon monoxide dehydrogenase subunit G